MDTVTVTHKDRMAFVDAYRLFTGRDNAFIEVREGSWGKLVYKLKSQDISPYEFFYFAVYHLGKEDRARITYKNYMCSDQVWQNLKNFKKRQPSVIRGLVQSQRKNLLAEIEDVDNIEDILLNPVTPVSSPVLLDTALLLAEEKDIDVQKVLDKFLADAVYTVYCSPEMMNNCIKLKLYMSENDLW